jgi:FAD/FMN-containing dehydrogenase
VPVGVVSATGIGGLSLHGGIGFLTRKYGLTSDQLVAADVVTADGQLRHTDEDHEPDLLWALRGGGGVGVVTSFEFRAHPVGPDVWMGIVMYPVAEASHVLSVFRSLMARAPDELMGLALYWSAPEDEPVPPEQRGVPVVVLVGCWSGPIEEGERAIQPLRELGTPVVDLSGRFPYLEAQRLFDPDYPNGRRYYWKSTYLPHIEDEVIAVLDRYAASRPSPISSIDVWALGGAFARVRPEATAFFRRQDPYLLGIEANWTDAAEDEENLRWVRELFAEMQSFSDGGAYFNFPGFIEEGETQLRRSFGPNLDRLRSIQARFDPDALFRSNLRLVGP